MNAGIEPEPFQLGEHLVETSGMFKALNLSRILGCQILLLELQKKNRFCSE